MAISLFDLFKVGIGPSSSHTVGPMLAARRFARGLQNAGRLEQVRRLRVELFGSLGATGKAHGTGPAVLLGLEGSRPDRVDPAVVPRRAAAIQDEGALDIAGAHRIGFDTGTDLLYHRRKSLPFHPNGLRFTALDADGDVALERTYYSVGGGFVVNEQVAGANRIVEDATPLPYAFDSGGELLDHCRRAGLSIADLMLANESKWKRPEAVRAGVLRLWQVMRECVGNGLRTEGTLPGGLQVRRRAPSLYASLIDAERQDGISGAVGAMGWVNLYALAVNEENAAGGRVVTAPTNGAAGIIPAVLHYYWHWCPKPDEDGIVRFLLTAAAIGILFKKNASISGAEVGCQGEVGSACAMAAAGLAAAAGAGATPEQVENAAEIGMEHHLGLTCDPIGGLVQIPCIERNAIGAVQAVNAAVMALRGDGQHLVSLDKVIRTMRDTGRDMLDKYKETARGGLAVNVIEC